MTRTPDLPEPPSPDGREVVVPVTADAWRRWLGARPERPEGVWVVYRKKSSHLTGPTYDDLLDEALCHGWIDSRGRRVDDDRMIQWFSPRRPGGLWSARNKRRLEELTRTGRMTPAGQAAIDRAVADGSWSQLDQVDALVVPPDLAAALAASPRARAAYDALPDSAKREHLWRVHSARRPATRAARIREIVGQLAGEDARG
ncbi:MAG TPA: YdeI/OmpD-associated family protein [Marmoricola sp.]|nr:YdeI/OmpD-associated family protein [Marmoricola sp.]